MAAKTPSPTAEVGYVNPNDMEWDHWDHDEQVAALQWPQSISTYTRMANEDGRVGSLLAAIKLPLQRTTWRIDQNGARDEVTEFVARDTGLPIDGAGDALPKQRARGRFSWGEHLEESLSRLEYGHSIFEQVYQVNEDRTRAHLRKLAPRPQETISKFLVARDGGLVGVRQHPPVGDFRASDLIDGGITLPVSRLVAYTRNRRPGQWIGRSILRPAYKHWLLKDEFLRIEAIAAYRNGVGIAHVQAGQDDPEQVARAVKIASEMRAAERGGVGTPPGWKVELLGVEGNLPDLRRAIDGHDKAIALAGLAHFLNLDRGGSYALASVQADTFVQSEQALADNQCETATMHIIEDLVDINWGEDEPAPRIVCDEIGTRQDATAAGLKMLVDAGLLSPDVLVEQRLRQQMGLPAQSTEDRDRDDDDEPPTAPEPPSPAAPTQSRNRGRNNRRRVRIEADGAMTLW